MLHISYFRWKNQSEYHAEVYNNELIYKKNISEIHLPKSSKNYK